MTGDNVFNANAAQTNTPVWINSGLLRKSGGAGFSQINNFNFNTQPSGVIQADTGILRLPSGTTNSAGILRVNGGQLDRRTAPSRWQAERSKAQGPSAPT